MLVDAVLGILPRERLPEALTIIHRSGLGPQARVLDPARGPLATQLERAGVIDAPALILDPDTETVLLVFAAGRMELATETMIRFGGRDVQTLGRRTSLTLPVSPVTADTRRTTRRASSRMSRPLPRGESAH